MTKLSANDLARQFCDMDRQDFTTFWLTVLSEWNMEDGDLEAQWFYSGKGVNPSVLTVISAMHSAVASGAKAARK